MARIISVANRKGGVGKTTVGLFLATALAKDGKKVIYLDCDSQASAYQYRKFEKDNVYGEAKRHLIKSDSSTLSTYSMNWIKLETSMTLSLLIFLD